MKQALSLCFLLLAANGMSQLPKVSSGRLERLANVPSKYVDARNVDVWLPNGYNPQKKYDVLYMHDGQNLYDSATTWNKQAWDVDDILTSLMVDDKVRDVIVVGVWNGGKSRAADYFPQKPFESLTKSQQDTIYAGSRNRSPIFGGYKVQSDGYLKFLVTELKPMIDSKYSTNKGRKGTFIMGSSMGGLISLYAICEYPDVFGGAGCLSTHWPGSFDTDNNPVPDAFYGYMRKKLPKPKTHKIYFDYGTATLDALYPPLQKKADAVMKEKGFSDSNWLTKEFPGADHSEKSWRKRLDIPLFFLLGK